MHKQQIQFHIFKCQYTVIKMNIKTVKNTSHKHIKTKLASITAEVDGKKCKRLNDYKTTYKITK